MRTLLFCTSYAQSQAKWDERWRRWLKAAQGSGVSADKILIVDDGSPILPDWPDVVVEEPGDATARSAGPSIHHFPNRLGQRVDGEPFPGWYRSFSHAVRFGIREGFDRILHIESDAFLISDRAVEFFNRCERGWVGLWCGQHRWPESTMQIINRDQFDAAWAFFEKPYSAYLGQPYRPIETLIPYTSINKELIGDRYGEVGDTVPLGADYVSQVRWDKAREYYWWLSEDGTRKPMETSEMLSDSFIDRYRRDLADGPTHSGVDYRQFLSFLDRQMLPRSYLEIGTHQGDSVASINCDAICIDPKFMISRDVVGQRRRTFFFQMTSDDFFEEHDPRKLVGPVDLGFLDGLHHFEALLKDFINFERHSHPGSLALLHDCLPLNTRMAGRVHEPGPDSEPQATRGFWTGDVWRALVALREFRPDLLIFGVDCPPTGLIVCAKLNSRSTDLMFKFESILSKYRDLSLDDLGLDRLWGIIPILSSREILAQPKAFCETLRFRR